MEHLSVGFCRLTVCVLQLAESKNREEQLKQQMAEKEEKTKKAIVGAKVKIGQVNSKFAEAQIKILIHLYILKVFNDQHLPFLFRC